MIHVNDLPLRERALYAIRPTNKNTDILIEDDHEIRFKSSSPARFESVVHSLRRMNIPHQRDFFEKSLIVPLS